MSNNESIVKVKLEHVGEAATCVGLGPQAESLHSSSVSPSLAVAGKYNMCPIKQEPMDMESQDEVNEELCIKEEMPGETPVFHFYQLPGVPEVPTIKEEPIDFSSLPPVEPETCWIKEERIEDSEPVGPDTAEEPSIWLPWSGQTMGSESTGDVDPLLGPVEVKVESCSVRKLKKWKPSSELANLLTKDVQKHGEGTARDDVVEIVKGPLSASAWCSPGVFCSDVHIREQSIVFGRQPVDICDEKPTEHNGLVTYGGAQVSEGPFECDFCGAKFVRRGHLRKHKRSHTGDKPYVCDVCKSTFRWSSELVVHKASHVPEKSYQSNEEFSCRCLLINHNRAQTREKPYNLRHPTYFVHSKKSHCCTKKGMYV